MKTAKKGQYDYSSCSNKYHRFCEKTFEFGKSCGDFPAQGIKLFCFRGLWLEGEREVGVYFKRRARFRRNLLVLLRILDSRDEKEIIRNESSFLTLECGWRDNGTD